MNKIFYNQLDKRWANYPYPSKSLPGATISSGGCGVCSCAMVISMLKKIVYPQEIADAFVKDGIRQNGGTSNKAYQYIANKYDLKTKRTEDYEELKECIRNNGLAVVGCGTGLFTSGAGHIIVIYGIRDDSLLIYDPYLYANKFNINGRNNRATIEGTTVVCSIENFKAYANAGGFWCYEGTNIDTNNDEEVPETKTEQYEVINVDSFLNIRSGAGLNYSSIGKLYKGNKIDVFEIQNGWAKIGEGKYVFTDYIRKVQAQPEYVLKRVTAKSGLNVREYPGTQYKIKKCYEYGTLVKVYEIQNGWARGSKGYMYTKYLK
jgi:hypothetical protein